jgi:putative ABC transport system permease protein
VSKQYDDAALRISVTSAKNLLRVSGAHTWVVLLDKTEDTQNVLAALKKQFSQRSQNLRFTPWNELADFYNKTVALYSRQMNVVEMIIALIIVLSIANTMTRTVLERTGEIGTLMALGHRRRKILRLFLAEGLMLGLAGGLLGISIGWLLATAISFVGIPMPPAPGMSTGFSGEIRLTAGLVTTAFVIAVSTTIMASIYPAWKASRLNVVDALRHNR